MIIERLTKELEIWKKHGEMMAFPISTDDLEYLLEKAREAEKLSKLKFCECS